MQEPIHADKPPDKDFPQAAPKTQSMIGWEGIVFRVVIGALLGALVGLEREMRGQVAGFRTHTLVAMGSTLFTLVSLYGFEPFFDSAEAAGQPYSFDPSRVAAQIVVGIGFLGAGAIMRHGSSVKGLTTAASLWVVAAMGMAVGAGFWTGALAVSLMLLVVLRGFRPAEKILMRWFYPEDAKLTISIDSAMLDSAQLIHDLEEEDMRVRQITSVRSAEKVMKLTLAIGITRRASANEIVERIRELSGVTAVEWVR